MNARLSVAITVRNAAIDEVAKVAMSVEMLHFEFAYVRSLSYS